MVITELKEVSKYFLLRFGMCDCMTFSSRTNIVIDSTDQLTKRGKLVYQDLANNKFLLSSQTPIKQVEHDILYSYEFVFSNKAEAACYEYTNAMTGIERFELRKLLENVKLNEFVTYPNEAFKCYS